MLFFTNLYSYETLEQKIKLHKYVYISQPLCPGRIWHKVNIFKQSLTGLNSEFSF